MMELTWTLSNPHRVLRALAVSRHTGKPFSSFLSGKKKTRDFQMIPVCLMRKRAELYERIERRVDLMMEQGLLEEARRLLPLYDIIALSKPLVIKSSSTISMETTNSIALSN